MMRHRIKRRVRIALFSALGAVAIAGIGTSIWALNRFVIDHVVIADVRAYEAAASADASATMQPSASASTSKPVAATPRSTPTTVASPTPTPKPARGTTPSAVATKRPTARPSVSVRPTVTATATATPRPTLTPSGPVITADSYTSAEFKLIISRVVTGTGNARVTYFVADVVLKDATSIRSAFANNEFGLNIIDATSRIARQNDAVFAINGDYYGFRDSGIEIRNGVIYRDKGARNALALYRDGSVRIIDETKTNAQALLDAGVWNTMSFGPVLLVNGEIPAGIEEFQVDTNFGARTLQGLQPRSAFGRVSANHYVFIAVDGRQPGYSIGFTTTELANVFKDLGCTVAYNLDGGGSTTMYFNGVVVNKPSGGSERGTSDIFYIGNPVQ